MTGSAEFEVWWKRFVEEKKLQLEYQPLCKEVAWASWRGCGEACMRAIGR